MKLVTLADIVGRGRDELVAAWCLCLLDEHMKRGSITGPEIDAVAAWRIVESKVSGGEPYPTDYEVAVGLVFVRATHSQFKLTSKGRAAADYMNHFKDAGHG